MKEKIELTPAKRKQLEEFMKRFHEALKKRPAISDEEFMAETEVSDEQYKIGLVLPGIGNEIGDVDE
jgi:HSP20 family molecular chaperone IbpA